MTSINFVPHFCATMFSIACFTACTPITKDCDPPHQGLWACWSFNQPPGRPADSPQRRQRLLHQGLWIPAELFSNSQDVKLILHNEDRDHLIKACWYLLSSSLTPRMSSWFSTTKTATISSRPVATCWALRSRRRVGERGSPPSATRELPG